MKSETASSVLIQTNLQGAVLQYLGRERQSGLSGAHHFNFRISPGRPDYRLTLVRAVDDQGREAKEVASYESLSDWVFALDAATNAASFDLTVALHRTRYIEFLARPQIITTNAAAPLQGKSTTR